MTLRDELTADVLAREPEGWKRRTLTHPQYEALEGGGMNRYREVFLGHEHITIRDTKTRLVLWPFRPVATGELARAYLRILYEGAGIEPRPSTWHSPYWQPKAPLYCRPVQHADLAYVDISSAHWQIAAPFGPDMLVSKERGEILDPGSVGWWRYDEVDTDRTLRHNIMGSIFSHGITSYRYGKEQLRKWTGTWANPSLYLTVMATLHAIALGACRRYDVRAWLTDACILPAEQASDLVAWLEDTWAIRSRIVAEGLGGVYRTTEYIVGDKVTENIRNGNATLEPLGRKDLHRHLPAPMLREWRNG